MVKFCGDKQEEVTVKKCERIKNNDCWFARKLNRGMRDEFGKQQSARDETRKYYDY